MSGQISNISYGFKLKIIIKIAYMCDHYPIHLNPSMYGVGLPKH